MSVLPAGSVAASASVAAAVPTFNPPSHERRDYSARVFYRKDVKVGKYYVMTQKLAGGYSNPEYGTIVKVTRVEPVPMSAGSYIPYGFASITVEEESGSILPPRTTAAYDFYEYRMSPNNIPIPNSLEPNEPLINNAARNAHKKKLRNYQLEQAEARSRARFYTRRGRKAQRRSRRSKNRK
jgi:hypothetical protein